MFDKEFKYYVDHQAELVEKYNGKFLIIVGIEVVGVFDTQLEAYQAGQAQFGLGNFLLQRCSEGQSDYTQTYHSRVSFA